ETSTTTFTLNHTISGSVDLPDDCRSIPYSHIAFLGVCLVISLCGMLGNGMVMWFLGFHMKKNPFTIYTLNLAVADFSLLLLFFLLILDFLTFAASCKYLFSLLYRYWTFAFTFEFLCHLFHLSGQGLLTALSVERCVSIL
ncbi:MAS protein, partial [Dasyornis broadbenti]|nr:MAS protein [Dasyornis broadbenti]